MDLSNCCGAHVDSDILICSKCKEHCDICKTEVCFSCDKEFEAEPVNDRDEGWFCDECLVNEQ